MGLSNLFQTTAKSKNSDTCYVGMKVSRQDADKLGAIVGLGPNMAGADIFRGMVKDILVKHNLINPDGTVKE